MSKAIKEEKCRGWIVRQGNNSSHEGPNSLYYDKCVRRFKTKSGMECHNIVTEENNQQYLNELNQDYGVLIARDYS